MSRMAVIEGNEMKYHVMDPTGNITILVETPVQEASQPFIAAELMRLETDAEQVGFLTARENDLRADAPDLSTVCDTLGGNAGLPGSDPHWDIALRMAGGEFCGNATMSAAALYAAKNGIDAGTVTVHVSGAAQPVPVDLRALPDGGYRGTVLMPRPFDIKEVLLPTAGGKAAALPVVRFEGIDHVILEEEQDRAWAEAQAPVWCGERGADALGLMFLHLHRDAAGGLNTEPDEQTDGNLTPLVYVPDAGTLVWENSCASGTSAAGVWAASMRENHTVRMTLKEPGGILSVEVSDAGEIRLTGTVRERTEAEHGHGRQ